jgi:hypothetical protein
MTLAGLVVAIFFSVLLFISGAPVSVAKFKPAATPYKPVAPMMQSVT